MNFLLSIIALCYVSSNFCHGQVSEGRLRTADSEWRSRYEYKYSFKGPRLSVTGETIPFWNITGDAVPGEDQIRVVPSLRGKSGGVWSKYAFPHSDWEVVVTFRVQGKGRVGADGLVIWLVEEPAHMGSVFGYMNKWKGLGVIFDSFDNDGKRNNPYISVVFNDGEMEYDHATDGIEQKLGGCFRDFRNRPYPVKARIRYQEGAVTVEIDNGIVKEGEFELCTRVPDVSLPKDYYFGVTAATGGLADDHDVMKFLTYSLHQVKEGVDPQEEDAEQIKLQEEYEQSLEEFKKEQEEYKEQHPDQVSSDSIPQLDEDELFGGAGTEELKAVFDVQNDIKKQIQLISVMTKNVLDSQNELRPVLEAVRTSSKSDSGDKIDPTNVATKADVDAVLSYNKISVDILNEIKGLSDALKVSLMALTAETQAVSSKVSSISSAGAGAGSDGAEVVRSNNQILEKITKIQNEVNAMRYEKPKLSCPDLPEMTFPSTFFFIMLAAGQLFILLAYHIYQNAQNSAAKKYF